MISKKWIIRIGVACTAFMLVACGSNQETGESPKKESDEQQHHNMEHSSSGEVPDDLKVEKDPKYKVGSPVTLQTGHMPGMKGAEATIVGAYDTTAYIVSYTPTTGGERVNDHKWVIQEELKDVGEETLKPGTEVTLSVSHMEGMKGASAVIDSSTETTVYMVDYKPTTGDEKVKNHKWVTESEIAPK